MFKKKFDNYCLFERVKKHKQNRLKNCCGARVKDNVK